MKRVLSFIAGPGYHCSTYMVDDEHVFLVDRKNEPLSDAAAEMVLRESRWLYGDLRVVHLDHDGWWVELKHDDEGHLARERFEGFVPSNEEWEA